MIIAGTGSRSLRKDEELFNKVYEEVRGRIGLEFKKPTLMSGMAEGFDEIIAKVAMDTGCPLICAIPNDGYLRYYWEQNSVTGKDRYDEACEICEYAFSTYDRGGYIEYVCDSVYVNGVHANFIRNEWMVNKADLMLVYNPTSRGTKHCFEYINKVNRKYEIIEVK